MEFIKKEYKHDDCGKLNEELNELISELSFQSEGLADNFMDIVLDHENQKEKEFSELYNAPLDWLESLLINTERKVVDHIIDKLTANLNKIVNKCCLFFWIMGNYLLVYLKLLFQFLLYLHKLLVHQLSQNIPLYVVFYQSLFALFLDIV